MNIANIRVNIYHFNIVMHLNYWYSLIFNIVTIDENIDQT